MLRKTRHFPRNHPTGRQPFDGFVVQDCAPLSDTTIHGTNFATQKFRTMPTHEIHAAHKLHDEIHFQIQRDLSAFGRNVSFEFNDSGVVLSGVVGSYYQKQMAQESLRRIEGLSRIDNRIQVVIR